MHSSKGLNFVKLNSATDLSPCDSCVVFQSHSLPTDIINRFYHWETNAGAIHTRVSGKWAVMMRQTLTGKIAGFISHGWKAECYFPHEKLTPLCVGLIIQVLCSPPIQEYYNLALRETSPDTTCRHPDMVLHSKFYNVPHAQNIQSLMRRNMSW
jgi:hypothetical protein